MSSRGTRRPRGLRRWSGIGVAAALGLALAACGSQAAPDPRPESPTPSASATGGSGTAVPSPAVPGPVDVSGVGWGHVHNLAYDGDALVLGTHEGLYRQPPGEAPVLLSETPFDVMGLAYDGSRWLASGHPAVGEDLPPDLGLRTSPDGRTWTTVSLLGEVDFHRLAASGSTVLGVAAHDGALLRSTDGGTRWTRLDNPGVVDLTIDPGSPAAALATTASGPVVSQDSGTTWTLVGGAPLIAVAAWTTEGLYGVAPDGTVHTSDDAGTTWQPTGRVGGQPSAIAATGDRIAVLVEGSVVESVDGGRTFSPRLVGIGDH